MNQNNLALITELRHTLHAHPEVSRNEKHTKQMLMDFLRQYTDVEIVDRGSWFYAYYAKTAVGNAASLGPIAFRADIDALPMEESIDLPYASRNPGAAHKCGHDGHSAVLAGLVLELAAEDRNRDAYLIFQHAEEIGGGGEECAQLIAEKGISEVYAFHNWSGFPEKSVIVRNGTIQCASKGLTIYMEGAPAHASEPEHGRNPAAALSDLVLAIKDEVEEPIRGSEDFGYFLKKCPGAIFYIGNGMDYPQLHTSEFDFNDRILETAVEMFKSLLSE